MSVRRAQREIDAAEFAEWGVILTRFEPMGDRRADFHAAQVVQTLCNCFRGKNSDPVKLSDALLNFDPQPEEENRIPVEHKVWAVFQSLAAQMTPPHERPPLTP
jgi:hypothetical protein